MPEPIIYQFSTVRNHSDQDEWSMIFCGDWAPFDAQSHIMSHNSAQYYGSLLPILQSANLAIVNLEGVLGAAQAQPIIKDGIHIRFPVETINGLTIVPFHLACMANNHIFDYGTIGLKETLSYLKQYGIQNVGAGLSEEEAIKPAFYELGGARVAILNVAEGEEARLLNDGPGAAPLILSNIRDQLHELQDQTDVRVVVVHAGREHLPAPAPYIRELYHDLVDSGATLVIGHHPHVPQGLEIYQGVPIAYSLGNFVLYMGNSIPFHTLGYLLEAHFQGPLLTAIKLWPYHINSDHLIALDGVEYENFQKDFNKLSNIINDVELNHIWEAYADRWLVASGFIELSDSLVECGQGQQMIKSLLKGFLHRYQGNSLHNRIMRRLLGYAIRQFKPTNIPFSVDSSKAGYGAAILRNRFDTTAHRELYLTALNRVMNEQAGRAPDWAYKLLDTWFTVNDP